MSSTGYSAENRFRICFYFVLLKLLDTISLLRCYEEFKLIIPESTVCVKKMRLYVYISLV